MDSELSALPTDPPSTPPGLRSSPPGYEAQPDLPSTPSRRAPLPNSILPLNNDPEQRHGSRRKRVQFTVPKPQPDPRPYPTEKIREITTEMHDRHKSSFKALLFTIADGQSHGRNRASLRQCIEWSESDLIDKAVLNRLRHQGWKPVTDILREELFNYGEAVLQGERPDVDEQDVSEMVEAGWLEKMIDIEVLRSKAPIWTTFFSASTKRRRDRTESKVDSIWLGSLLAQLCQQLQPRKNKMLKQTLGMFLHHCNLTRRGIEVLNSLGIIDSYWTINRNIKRLAAKHVQQVKEFGKRLNRAIVYDNLNLTDGIRETRVGDEKKLWNISTGLTKICKSIPASGIDRSQFQPTYHLSRKDIVPIDPTSIRKEHDLKQQVSPFALPEVYTYAYSSCTTTYMRVSRRVYRMYVYTASSKRQHAPPANDTS
jgi:hypothetical protein